MENNELPEVLSLVSYWNSSRNNEDSRKGKNSTRNAPGTKAAWIVSSAFYVALK